MGFAAVFGEGVDDVLGPGVAKWGGDGGEDPQELMARLTVGADAPT